jgi:hypothetical protein
MRYGRRWKIVHRVKGQKHQAEEEERREAHHVADHFALGNQVHEITGHQKRLHPGNQQRNANVDFTAAKRNERRPDGQASAK